MGNKREKYTDEEWDDAIERVTVFKKENTWFVYLTVDGNLIRIKDEGNVARHHGYYFSRDTTQIWDANGNLIGKGNVVRQLILSENV